MTLSGFVAAWPHRMRANWSAVLLPVPVVGMIVLVRSHHIASWTMLMLVLVLALAAAAALLVPSVAAKTAPFAWFTYGCVGFLVVHSLLRWRTSSWFYGGATAYLAGGQSLALVLPKAFLIMIVSVGLLVVADAPGSNAVRRAAHQVFGTGGQPKTVPALLLLPVLGLWEETYANPLWFGSKGIVGQLIAIVILAVGVALVVWRQQLAAIFAVLGMIGLGIVLLTFALIGWPAFIFWAHHGPAQAFTYFPKSGVFSGLNGLVVLDSSTGVLLTKVEGWVLIGLGVLLVPRMLVMADPELVRRAAALTQRVDRLSRTRRDATETAVAELRRIERDLHDGAQARLVAVGMSLRAAEQLMASSPAAALALVAEARETSSRALDDLRGLVRGIYPPVLADRGLADAVRTLALDTPLTVETDITLSGEPSMPVAAAVYFGIAEVLTNAVRHSGADTVQIGIGYAGGLLRASVTDDGVGGADASRGTGLVGVERRLATFDGVLAVSSPLGGPTIVVLEVPCALAG